MSERWPLPQAHDRCTALSTPFQNRTAERVAGNAVAPEFRGGGRARGCLGAILHNAVIGQRRSPERSVASWGLYYNSALCINSLRWRKPGMSSRGRGKAAPFCSATAAKGCWDGCRNGSHWSTLQRRAPNAKSMTG